MPEVRWRLQSAFPKSLDTLWGGAELFCRLVSDLTEGRFQIQPFAAGEIVGTFQVARRGWGWHGRSRSCHDVLLRGKGSYLRTSL